MYNLQCEVTSVLVPGHVSWLIKDRSGYLVLIDRAKTKPLSECEQPNHELRWIRALLHETGHRALHEAEFATAKIHLYSGNAGVEYRSLPQHCEWEAWQYAWIMMGCVLADYSEMTFKDGEVDIGWRIPI